MQGGERAELKTGLLATLLLATIVPMQSRADARPQNSCAAGASHHRARVVSTRRARWDGDRASEPAVVDDPLAAGGLGITLQAGAMGKRARAYLRAQALAPDVADGRT
jgi:hypothetical protein